jgi:LmbE family N-acetylglucosaminyl deacetylase
MTGWGQNDHDHAFCQAGLDDAAGRLAAVLLEERADVLTIYDWHGNYGHPDHVQVHRVGSRAAQLVADELPALRVLEATMNRDELRRQMQLADARPAAGSVRRTTSIPTARWTTATRWGCPSRSSRWWSTCTSSSRRSGRRSPRTAAR